MRIPLEWLKEYVDINMTDGELAQKLTLGGLEVTAVEDTSYGKIFEVEVTSNRPDWLSLLGIAREIYALEGKGKLKIPDTSLPHKKGFEELFNITIADKEKCPRYTARIIEEVKIEPSPEWLKKKVESFGLRSICNVVDITNLVLFEYGQPLHAFDLNKLSGNLIVVRMAKNGEKIKTIDGAQRSLDKDILVIADSEKLIAIAGVMGSENSEVDFNTKNVILESACFDGPSIRRTSRKIGLGTDSSYRFERSVDWEAVRKASDRAAQLICQYAGGKIRNEFFDSAPGERSLKRIKIKKQEVCEILAVEIDSEKIKKILKRLGISSITSGKASFEFEIPSHRRDLNIAVDLVEEIARIFGYDNIPIHLPVVKPNLELECSSLHKTEDIIREALKALGFNEVINYSLTSSDVLRNLRIKSDDVISIQNPLSSEMAVLRPSLLPGIVQSLSYNLNRRIEQVKIFELAHVYSRENGKVIEKLNLSFGLSGLKYIYDWEDKPKNLDFFDGKGTIEVLFKTLGISNFNFSESGFLSLFNPSDAAAIMCKEKIVGYMGEVCKELLEEFDINSPVFVGELFINPLFSFMDFDKKFASFSTYPFIIRDIAILIDENIPAAHVMAVIKRNGKELVKDIRLFDRYAGQQIPSGCVSLAFSIKYQSGKKTLTDEEVNEVHSKVCLALREELKAQIR